jgi:mannose-6-phosphate isomerase class I
VKTPSSVHLHPDSQQSTSGEDQKIENYNEKLLKTLDTLTKAEKAVCAKQQELLEERRPEKRQKTEGELEKKQRAEERARKTFKKQRADRDSLKRGSGKVSTIEFNVSE